LLEIQRHHESFTSLKGDCDLPEDLKHTLINKAMKTLGNKVVGAKLEKLAGDISSRSYYVISLEDQKYIACLTQKDNESQNEGFIYWRNTYHSNGIRVPDVYDYEKGFILQEYIGDKTFLESLSRISGDSLEKYYQKILDILLSIHSIEVEPKKKYERLDTTRFLREVEYTHHYLLKKYVAIEDGAILEIKEEMINLISLMNQEAKVISHRDFHAKNIMIDLKGKFCAIDFQDSMLGSPLYDMASLLNDCYTNLSSDMKKRLLSYYITKSSHLSHLSSKELEFQFDLYSVQRVYKALGNFTAVWANNQNPYYLRYIAFGMEKLRSITMKYPQMSKFQSLLFSNYYGK